MYTMRMTILSTSHKLTEGEKNQGGGGWIVFSKTFLSYVLKNCSQIQSLTWVQSLSAADKGKRTEKERTQAIIQVLSTNRK